MKVLVIGSGGREHALCWKIAQSVKVKKLYCAPGNGGIAQSAQIIDIKADDVNRLVDFASQERIDLTIVGPEVPLVAGIVDRFLDKGLKVFGPSKDMARLEGSKVFAKEAMRRLGVPTADFKMFLDAKEAHNYIEERSTPLVIKADGLAAGKGVIVCKAKEEAHDAIKRIMEDNEFGLAGDKVVIEDCLIGEEASIMVVSDGKNFIPLVSSQDHKRIFDGDKGPNTGGMGAYSPAPVVEGENFKRSINEIIKPMILGLAKEGTPFKGILYAGIMITEDGPKTLEFNVRFGDPETQAVLPRMKTDLVELTEASIDGTLDKIKMSWDDRPCACVVVASGGYPGPYRKGKEIEGLKGASGIKDAVVFHAGTRVSEDGKIVTSGGRVLGVTALGETLEEAVKRSYEAVSKIKFDKMYYRKDIAQKAFAKKV
ncbi:MAG: phosphoribosylamine--glycine ligase [Candidatus Omnitrophica bacterium]|nr:phosphoribosylamine--glycine ligase [Candidatus Omnitrophota bacterium]